MLSPVRLPAGSPLERLPVRLAGDVPVEPDADQARDWAREELAGRIYEDAKPGLAERVIQSVLDWLGDALSGLGGLGTGPGVLILAATAVLLVALLVLVIRPRLNAKARKKDTSGVFATDLVETAADHRKRAGEAASEQRWDTAVAERFRAMVRSAEERVIFEVQPARTAAEAANSLSGAFPDSGADIMWLSRRFDEILYGVRNMAARAADYQRALELDSLLEETRPSVAELDSSALPGLAVPR